MTSSDQGEFLHNEPVRHTEAMGAMALTGVTEFDTANEPTTLLSSEQRNYALAVVESMAESLGLNKELIRFVIEDTPEYGKRIVAIDSSPNGQHIGLYQSILAQREVNPDWYTFEVEGQRIDPLAGCTRRVYEAMIIDARARGEQYLPDSLALNQKNGHVWTATMMTGEPLESEGHIWIGSSSSYNKVNFVGQPIGRGGKSFRVRPAVIVGQIGA